jgi:MFS family permease
MPSPLLIATSISAALAMGMVPVLFRSLRAPLKARHLLSESRLDQLNKLLILSWVPLMPLAGWLVDHWGLREVLFTGSLLLGMAVSWLALCQDGVGVFWGILGLGFAGACVTTSGVALMPPALSLYPHWSLGASLCLGYVFVGLASLLTPVCIPWLARRFSFRGTALSLGLLCLLPATLVALAKTEIPTAGPMREGALYDVRFWLIGLVAFLYSPLEQSLEVWPRRYLAEIGYTARSIFRLLVGFWCAFLLVRFGLGWIIGQGNEDWFVLILLVLSSMVLGNLASAYSPSSGYFGFWLVGACYGPIFPALLGTLELAGPRHIPGQTLGMLFALSALGSFIVQPLMVNFSRSHGPRECMRLPMLLGLLMAAPTVVIALMRHGK